MKRLLYSVGFNLYFCLAIALASLALSFIPLTTAAAPPNIGEEKYYFNYAKDDTGRYIRACGGVFAYFSEASPSSNPDNRCIEFENDSTGDNKKLEWSRTLTIADSANYCRSGDLYSVDKLKFTIKPGTAPALEEDGSISAKIIVDRNDDQALFPPGGICESVRAANASSGGMGIRIADGDKLSTLIGTEIATVESNSGSSCNIQGGLGWLLCPVLSTMAMLTDAAWGILDEYFFEIPPIDTSTGNDNTLYQAWSAMRNLANGAFVLAFMFIIYSQLTSMGVSNYGVKKMLPRLIIGAVLVNTSYWICALAVDIGNVAGGSIYDLLVSLNGDVTKDPDNPPAQWQTYLGNIVGTGIALGALYLAGLTVIVPLLISAVVFVLGLVLALAIRHAVLLILIVSAPIAAIAYMLPNTDKVSKSWWTLFKLLLLLYPLVAFVVGSAVLAGSVIFDAANGNIVMELLGIATPALGIVGIPLMIKATSGVLGRFGFANPFSTKGALRDWAKQAGTRADKWIGTREFNREKAGGRALNLAARNFGGSRRARRSHLNNLRNQTLDNKIEAGITRSNKFGKLSSRLDASQKDLDIAKGEVEIENMRTNRELHVNAAIDNLRLSGAKAELEAIEKELKAGVVPEGVNVDDKLAITAKDAAQYASIQQMRGQSADRVSSSQLTSAIKNSDKLARDAAGIDSNRGVDRVRAAAIAAEDKETAEAINNRIALLEDTYNAEQLASAAKSELETAVKSGDKVGARAAVRILARQTGSFGVSQLEEAMKKIEEEVETDPSVAPSYDDVMVGVKYDIAGSGLKGKSSALDKFATGNETFTYHMDNVATVERLNQNELAGQTQKMLERWKDNNIISYQQADAVLQSYKKGTLPLDPGKLKIFKDIVEKKTP